MDADSIRDVIDGAVERLACAAREAAELQAAVALLQQGADNLGVAAMQALDLSEALDAERGRRDQERRAAWRAERERLLAERQKKEARLHEIEALLAQAAVLTGGAAVAAKAVLDAEADELRQELYG